MTIIIIGFWWCLLRIGSSIVILWFVIALLYSILSMLEGSIGEMFLAMRATIVVVVVYTTIWFMRRIMKGNGALRYDQMA
jgi:fumarate reductase subunit C